MMNRINDDEYNKCGLGVRKGCWMEEEDRLLRDCVQRHGEGSWHQVPKRAGLNRCRKSCRLRWLNYLKPNINRGVFTLDELDLIIRLHSLLGNRWSLIAGRLPGRTGNNIKNYWNTHMRKRMIINNNNNNNNNSKSEVGRGRLQVMKKKDDEIGRRHEVIRPRARRVVSSAVWTQSSHVTQTATIDNNNNNNIDEDDWWKTLVQQEQQLLLNIDDHDDSNKLYHCNNTSSRAAAAAAAAATRGGETLLFHEEVQQTAGGCSSFDFNFDDHDLHLWNF